MKSDGGSRDAIPTVKVDPYLSLAWRYSLDYSYSLRPCEMTGEYFLVREVPDKGFLRHKDPGYIRLCAEDWYGEEFGVYDELPSKQCIATPFSLNCLIQNEYRGFEVDTVSIDDICVDETTVDLFKNFSISDVPKGTSNKSKKRRRYRNSEKKRRRMMAAVSGNGNGESSSMSVLQTHG